MDFVIYNHIYVVAIHYLSNLKNNSWGQVWDEKHFHLLLNFPVCKNGENNNRIYLKEFW